MSGKKNQSDIDRRRRDVYNEVTKRQNEKVENVVNEIAERLYLRPSSIWRDLRLHKEKRGL